MTKVLLAIIEVVVLTHPSNTPIGLISPPELI
jgi:hypothetical protein